MAVSTNPNFRWVCHLLVPHLSDTENYWGFQGYSPFQPEMYHDRNTATNMSNSPTPRGSTTPVTMATAFCPIEKMPPTSTGEQLMQVSHSQVLNLPHKSPSTSGSIVRRQTPVRIGDQPVDKSESSAGQTQNQPVTLVSFASTTQVRMDIAVPLPVGQGVSQVLCV